MDDITFYYPSWASSSQPRPLPGAPTLSIASSAPIASLSVRQTASQLDQRNEMSKNQMAKSRNVSDLSQKSHSDQRRRNDTIQDQDLTIRNPPNSDDDDLPDINELLSGIWQKNNSVSADPNSDDGDDGFVDIDAFLSGIQQKSIPASANPNSGSVAEEADNGTRGGSSPATSRCSTVGNSRDPTVLSDDESIGAESATDYGDLDIDLTAKSSVDPPHIADSNGFGSGTALTPNCRVADHPDGDDDNNHLVDNAQLRLSAKRPRSASPGHGSVIHQASKLQADTDITQGRTSYVDLDATKKLESGTRSTKRSKLSAAANNNPAFDGNMPELHEGQHDYAQSPRLGPAAASLYPSDLKNGNLPARRGVTRTVRRKRPRMTVPTGPASTTSTTSGALESRGEPQPCAQSPAPNEEEEVRDIGQETVDDRNADDSDDRGYVDKRGGRPRSCKRARRMEDTEENDVEASSSYSFDVSCRAAAATPSGSMQESDEIPIHGYFTLKMIESKVVYCLTFSQELLPRPHDQEQKQDNNIDLEEPQSAALVADPTYKWGIRKIIGQKMVGRERHYRVEWKETWMRESELTGAKELVDAFMADDGSGTGSRKRPLKRSQPATGQPDARGEEEPKRRRGRPRKQT